MNQDFLEEPVENANLERLLRRILDVGELRFSGHALEEMDNDNLVEQDIRNCLWAGRPDGCDFEKGSWRYRVRTGWIVAVVVLRSETQAVVVTAWREQ